MISGTALHEWVRMESATYYGDLAARSWGSAIDMIVVAALERIVVEVYEPVSRAPGRSCSVRRTAVFTADGDDDDDTRGRRVLRVLRDARGRLPHFDAFVPHDDDSSHPAPHSLSQGPTTRGPPPHDSAGPAPNEVTSARMTNGDVTSRAPSSLTNLLSSSRS